jgi:putative redox protein
MVPQSIVYLGQLRCKATHGPSKVELVTDAPTDNKGRGESFSPTDIVVTAMVTCQLTTMGIAARRDDVTLNGTKVYAEKHMSTEGSRRIARMVIRMDFPSGIPLDFRPKLEDIARTCPVALSIHPDIRIDQTFSYPD